MTHTSSVLYNNQNTLLECFIDYESCVASLFGYRLRVSQLKYV